MPRISRMSGDPQRLTYNQQVRRRNDIEQQLQDVPLDPPIPIIEAELLRHIQMRLPSVPGDYIEFHARTNRSFQSALLTREWLLHKLAALRLTHPPHAESFARLCNRLALEMTHDLIDYHERDIPIPLPQRTQSLERVLEEEGNCDLLRGTSCGIFGKVGSNVGPIKISGQLASWWDKTPISGNFRRRYQITLQVERADPVSARSPARSKTGLDGELGFRFYTSPISLKYAAGLDSKLTKTSSVEFGFILTPHAEWSVGTTGKSSFLLRQCKEYEQNISLSQMPNPMHGRAIETQKRVSWTWTSSNIPLSASPMPSEETKQAKSTLPSEMANREKLANDLMLFGRRVEKRQFVGVQPLSSSHHGLYDRSLALPMTSEGRALLALPMLIGSIGLIVGYYLGRNHSHSSYSTQSTPSTLVDILEDDVWSAVLCECIQRQYNGD